MKKFGKKPKTKSSFLDDSNSLSSSIKSEIPKKNKKEPVYTDSSFDSSSQKPKNNNMKNGSLSSQAS